MSAHHLNYQYLMASMTDKQLCINAVAAIHLFLSQQTTCRIKYRDS